jgi:hypothetical protein
LTSGDLDAGKAEAWENACLAEARAVLDDLRRQAYRGFENVGEPRLEGTRPDTRIVTPVRLRDGREHDLDFPLWDELASGPVQGRATSGFVATLVMTDVIESL